MFSFTRKIKVLLNIVLLTVVLSSSFLQAQTNWIQFFYDDFENGFFEDWGIDQGWEIIDDGTGNHVLSSAGVNNFITFKKGHLWTDYILKLDLKFNTVGPLHLSYRNGDDGRYIIEIEPDRINLLKDIINDDLGIISLNTSFINFDQDILYKIEISGQEGDIRIIIDDELILNYLDDNQISHGGFEFTEHDDTKIYIDNIEVIGEPIPTAQLNYSWTRMGGPIGGIGYDIRIHPEDKNIMFVIY